MKKTIIALSLATVSTATIASPWKIITEDASFGIENYEAKIQYPKIKRVSWVWASKTISKNIKANLMEYGCLGEGETVDEYGASGMDYEATAAIIGLNKNYVGIKVNFNSYCGGAHPNHGTYFLSYNSMTGEEIKMDEEVPGNNYDNLQREEVSLALAEIILDNSDMDSECLAGENREENIREIADFQSPKISGIAKDKMVVISTNVAHAMKPCEVSLRVPYSSVKSFIKSGSILHKILK